MFVGIILLIAAVFLAYANGANDNIKGVATLIGSQTLNYKKALIWATVTQIAGSITSIFFAAKLVKAFSGKGLIASEIAVSPEFLLAVALGAALTVMLATITGFPISTTHALTGALVGAGFVLASDSLNIGMLGKTFFLPLLVSPLLALLLAAIVYVIFRFLRYKLGITKEWCICFEQGQEECVPVNQSSMSIFREEAITPPAHFVVKSNRECSLRYSGNIVGLNSQKILDFFHILSAGVVCFARGLNDTPKIVALLLVLKGVGLSWGMVLVGVGMAVGGVLSAKKVANTISNKITSMNHGQAFSANLVSGILIIFASGFGVPVSTTHISVGAIFGIGSVSGSADYHMIKKIVASWVITLPVAAIASALIAFII